MGRSGRQTRGFFLSRHFQSFGCGQSGLFLSQCHCISPPPTPPSPPQKKELGQFLGLSPVQPTLVQVWALLPLQCAHVGHEPCSIRASIVCLSLARLQPKEPSRFCYMRSLGLEILETEPVPLYLQNLLFATMLFPSRGIHQKSPSCIQPRVTSLP